MSETHTTALHDYRLGDRIALEDLLALPPDGRRYDRDAEGRLILMSPEHARHHRWPIMHMYAWLHARLPTGWWAAPEPSVAFEPIWSLRGLRLPLSRLGVRCLEPDFVVFDRRPRFWPGRPDVPDPGWEVFAPEGARLVIEVLSPRTQGSDLGQGSRDAVDRWRTFLDNGGEEYWVLNASDEPCGLPARSGLFLARADDRWAPLPGEGLRAAPGEPVHGLAPLVAGAVRSGVLGCPFEIDAFWRALDGE